MPSRGDRQSLLDILDNIRLAREFTADVSLETFENDVKVLYATTRCLEIVSEASRRVSAEMKARHASVPWPIIAAAGNVYRHDYRAVPDRGFGTPSTRN